MREWLRDYPEDNHIIYFTEIRHLDRCGRRAVSKCHYRAEGDELSRASANSHR